MRSTPKEARVARVCWARPSAKRSSSPAQRSTGRPASPAWAGLTRPPQGRLKPASWRAGRTSRGSRRSHGSRRDRGGVSRWQSARTRSGRAARRRQHRRQRDATSACVLSSATFPQLTEVRSDGAHAHAIRARAHAIDRLRIDFESTSNRLRIDFASLRIDFASLRIDFASLRFASIEALGRSR